VMRDFRWLSSPILLISSCVLSTSAAFALPAPKVTEREAALLQEAFSHNLCARTDSEQAKMNRLLRRSSAGARR
jgi:hypothetical protein